MKAYVDFFKCLTSSLRPTNYKLSQHCEVQGDTNNVKDCVGAERVDRIEDSSL